MTETTLIAQFWAEVIADGRITIPYEIRQGENIKSGDRVKVSLLEIKDNG